MIERLIAERALEKPPPPQLASAFQTNKTMIQTVWTSYEQRIDRAEQTQNMTDAKPLAVDLWNYSGFVFYSPNE
eukprot:4810020-Amphidinium_carterae.1